MAPSITRSSASTIAGPANDAPGLSPSRQCTWQAVKPVSGNHADLDVSSGQNIVEPLVPRPAKETLHGVVDVVPFFLEKLLAGLLGGVDVQLVEVGSLHVSRLAGTPDNSPGVRSGLTPP